MAIAFAAGGGAVRARTNFRIAAAPRWGDALGLRCIAAVGAAPQPETECENPPAMAPLTGTWRNRSGSVLRIEEPAPGEIAGAMVTAKGRIDTAAAYPVVGHATAGQRGIRRVSLSVLWQREGAESGSVTAFAGKADFTGAPARMELHWILSWHPDEAADEWTALHLGKDEFVRVEEDASADG
jgi:hypothetical protein